jgi:hypothetical protein
MPLEDWVRHSRHDMFLYDWQTLIAGVLALLAGIGTVAAAIGAIWVTRSTAKKQIDAAREEADRVIAATRDQTETTVDLARMRDAGEASAFRVMLEASMARVIDELALARTAVSTSVNTPTIQGCITKGGFEELRGGCLRLGSPLTGEFLDLEREIDNFALALWDRDLGLRKLDSIEAKATKLRDKAVAEMAPAVTAAPGPFAPAEAEALIGAPAPAEPEPRRSWLRWWFGWRAAG